MSRRCKLSAVWYMGCPLNISHIWDGDSSGYRNTEKRVEITTRRSIVHEVPVVWIAHEIMSRVFDIFLNREFKSLKSTLIKIGYPNPLHGCDFFLTWWSIVEQNISSNVRSKEEKRFRCESQSCLVTENYCSLEDNQVKFVLYPCVSETWQENNTKTKKQNQTLLL